VIRLLRGDGLPLRIGHRGAAALAPENTLASLRAAVELGVDAVEIDVLPRPGGTLVLAHAEEAAELAATLDEALELLAPTSVVVQVDVKGAGYEAAVVAALRRHRLLERSFVSSSSLSGLEAFARAEPALPRSLTYPEDRHGLTSVALLQPLVHGGLVMLRAALPYRLPAWLGRSRAAAATLHHSVVSPRTVARCHALGIAVLAWTVNEPELVKSLLAAGIDGIITDDPRILDLCVK
jgi:glycerophosphoryl diester phosphodiesterase